MTGPVYDVFTASNGYEVRTNTDGTVSVFDDMGFDSLEDGPYLKGNDLAALREFFQRERDARLGRWRWPEHPEYVVYPQGKDLISVIDESSGDQYTFERSPWDSRPMSRSAYAAAYAYFEAHPVVEPRPWENTKPGEVWVVTREDGVEFAHQVHDEHWYLRVPIKSARRIWPEADQ